MKTTLVWFVFVVLCAVVRGAPEESRITEVTLFADRALVTREAVPELPAGSSEVELGPLPGWVNPASVRARVEDGEVLDVRSRREFLSRTPDEELHRAEEEVRALEDRMAEIGDRMKALEAKREQVEQIRTFASSSLPAEVVRRDIPVAYFREMTDFVHDSLVEIDTARRTLEAQKREVEPELTASRNRLRELRKGNRLERVCLTLRVRAPQAGPRPLAVTYELPGATWEATHDVRIDEENRVHLVSLARVRQTSGEDWENVRLSFSTRRPGHAAQVPELEALLLERRHAVNRTPFSSSSSSSGWEVSNRYYLANALQFNERPGKKARGDLNLNFQAQQETQQRSQRVFSELEERGTTAVFEAEGRYTVRSDGNVERIPYADVKAEGDLRILAAPEISTVAARGLEMTYRHDRPLLPGDAALFLEGAYIGNTRLDFAGPGESFVLFAGSEDSLKLTRKLNHEESELKRGRRTHEMRVQFEITVENTGDKELPLHLADRIPVSDDREIEVDHVRIEPEVEPDADGLLQWEVRIPPKSTRTFVLRYGVEYPAGLLAVGRMNTAESLQQRDPSVPGAVRQILKLESMF